MEKEKTILIVDDDPVSRRFIRDIAHKVSECIVIEASSLKEAFDLAREKTPSIIFFDHFLTDGTGIEFCKKISKDSKLKAVPKWLFTGSDPVLLNLKELKNLGVLGYFTKPAGIEQIIGAINNSLNLKPKENLLGREEKYAFNI